MRGTTLLAALAMLVVSQSAAPAAATPGLFKPPTLFANHSLANKTAALLAVANAKERNIVASLGAKPNATVLASTVAAYKNLTSGNALSIVSQPPASGSATPTGTLQCLVNADGTVAGVVGSNGAGLCASSAGTTSVAIPVGDGYISGLQVAVAKAGPPYVGQLIFSVSPRGGGKPSTYWCGFGGGVPATLLSPKQSLAVYDLQAGCVPAAAGRRRLAAAGAALDLGSLQVKAGPPPAPDAAVPTMTLNSVPAAGDVNGVASAVLRGQSGSTTPTLLGGAPPTSFVYVTDQGNVGPTANSVSRCTPSNNMLNCVTTGSAMNLPMGIAFSGGFAFVANVGDNTVRACQVFSGGLLGNCVATGSGFNSPRGIAISNGIAYVTSIASGGFVSACAVSGGNLNNCATAVSGITAVDGIAVAGGFAYLTTRTNQVLGCSVSGTTITNCAPTSTGAVTPWTITVYNGIAYVLDVGSGGPVNVGQVIACTPSNGALTNCVTALPGSSFPNPAAIAVSGVNAYVTNNAGNVLKCAVSGMTLTGCVNAATGFLLPWGIAINPAAPTVTPSTATLVNSITTLTITGTGFNPTGTNTVVFNNGARGTVVAATSTQLTVQLTTTPALGALTAVVVSFGLPSGAPVQVANIVRSPFVFVSDVVGSSVSGCTPSGGTLNCATTGSGFAGPWGIAISNGIAYVANDGDGTVKACTVLNSTLTNCATATSGFNQPRGIAISNGIAYITNYGGTSVSSCVVNGATLTNCMTAATGLTGSFNGPLSIAISGGVAFVGTNTGPVFGCAVNGMTLANCAPAGPTFTFPSGMAVDGGTVYVAENGSTVLACAASGATLANCAPAASGLPAQAIAIYGGSAYVASGQQNGNTPGLVTRCTVSAGTLINCVTAASGFVAPFGIAVSP